MVPKSLCSSSLLEPTYSEVTVSQPQHCWHLGPDHSCCGGCIVGCCAAPLTSGHQMPAAMPDAPLPLLSCDRQNRFQALLNAPWETKTSPSGEALPRSTLPRRHLDPTPPCILAASPVSLTRRLHSQHTQKPFAGVGRQSCLEKRDIRVYTHTMGNCLCTDRMYLFISTLFPSGFKAA